MRLKQPQMLEKKVDLPQVKILFEKYKAFDVLRLSEANEPDRHAVAAVGFVQVSFEKNLDFFGVHPPQAFGDIACLRL
jgi:hypothetical protein